MPFQEHFWDFPLGSQWKFSVARGVTAFLEEMGVVGLFVAFCFPHIEESLRLTIFFSFDLFKKQLELQQLC